VRCLIDLIKIALSQEDETAGMELGSFAKVGESNQLPWE
jgi:hypothetical protein